MKGILLAISISLVAAFAATPAQALLLDDGFVPVEIFDEHGELVWVQELDPENPLLIKTTHYYRLGQYQADTAGAKPGSGGGGSNDCSSTAYKLTGWHWTSAFSMKAASYASEISSAGKTWDAATGASIFGGATSGKSGEAGTYDGVNQVEWEYIGSSSTVAVTTTWSYRGSGQAVETDAQYNTYYKWSTSGASDAMDVLHVATHEMGHSFGLDHPSGKGAECLTMYAYVNYGETHGRTLGTGDILGIQAIYGA